MKMEKGCRHTNLRASRKRPCEVSVKIEKIRVGDMLIPRGEVCRVLLLTQMVCEWRSQGVKEVMCDQRMLLCWRKVQCGWYGVGYWQVF